MRLQTPSKTGTLCVKQRSDQSNAKSKAPGLGSSQVQAQRRSGIYNIEKTVMTREPGK